MAKKENKPSSYSQDDNIQAQHIFEHYQQIAADLHASTDRKQAEAALASVNALSEAAQMVLLNVLSKEHHSTAADVLSAIYELSQNKNVRKEARRSLIRLQGVRVYPQWHPPGQQPLVVQAPPTPLQFWKGVVTDTRASGVVQLILCFHEEET